MRAQSTSATIRQLRCQAAQSSSKLNLEPSAYTLGSVGTNEPPLHNVRNKLADLTAGEQTSEEM